MSRTWIHVCAIIAVVLSIGVASDAESQHCPPPPVGSGNVGWGWGDNFFGQVGDGTAGNQRHTPVQVQNLSEVTAISAGFLRGLALRNDGTVRAWGRNQSGQLGDGTLINRHAPVLVLNLRE